MGSPKTQPRCLEFLTSHPGKPVSARDLSAYTGFTAGQVQAAVRNLIASGYPIKVIMRAQVWQYEPEPETVPEPETGPASGDVWEVIGRSKNGKIILRDGSGILYGAEPLDV